MAIAESESGTRCCLPPFMREAGIIHMRESRSISDRLAPVTSLEMRLGVIAALITLGLAVVAPLIALDMHVISPTQKTSGTVFASASQAALTDTDVTQAPMADVAHASA